MGLEFDTRFKHPWTMIVSGPSSSGKTAFTKQVFNKSDIGSIPNGKTDTKIARESALSRACYHKWVTTVTTLDAYLELSGPKAMVFDDMMMQCARRELIAQAFSQKRHHQHLSVILILQNLYCQGKVMRDVHLNTEYVVLFRNQRDKSQFGHLARQLEPKHSKALVTVLVYFGGSKTSHARCTALQK